MNTLLSTYWTAAGWRPKQDRSVPEAEFAHAKAAGFMFDPVVANHDEFVERLAGEVSRCDKIAVANAFLASLSTRRLEWRSALGSYAVFHRMRPHASPAQALSCLDCGMYLAHEPVDLNVLNFERFKWGGVRHSHVEYALLDLTLFARTSIPGPTSEDIDIFRELIAALRAVEVEVTASSLHKHLPKCLKANKAERDVLVGILGLAGILGTPDHPGFAERFIPARSRELPNRRFVDLSYPACWWSGRDGINETALTYFFGHIQ